MTQQLVTGEAVTLHLRPARLASRIVARTLDIGIELVALFLLLQLVGVLEVADDDVATAIGILLAVAFMVGYPVAFETLWRGLTPGKAAMGIRVVRDDGGPIRFRHALTRGLLNLVDLWLSFASVGMIVSLLSERGRRLGDVIAGTFVIQERVPRQHLTPVYMPPQLAGWAATLDLSRLPDDLALAVRGFLGRAGSLRPDARDRLGHELASAVAACVTPLPPPGTPPGMYLAAVVAERRRRDEARLPGGRAYPGAPPGAYPGPPGAYPSPPGPSPWQPAAPSAGWGGTPARPPWQQSAPPTGHPPPVGPPPPVGAPPPDPGPPRLPSAPSPQWGPPPVPPSPPPPSPAHPPPDDTESAAPAVPADGFALPG